MQNFTKNSFSLFLKFPQFLSSKYIINKSYLTEIINEVSIKNKWIYRAIEEKCEIIKYEEQYFIHKSSERSDEDRQNIRT